MVATEELKAQLERFLRQETGEKVTVSRLTPVAGGASRETWSFLAQIGGAARPLLLRMDAASTMNPEAIGRAEEFRLLEAAFAAGVTCPRPFWCSDDDAALGAPFLIMAFVEGESIGPRVVRRPELAAARARLPEEMAVELARIHSLDASRPALAFLPRPSPGTTPAQHTVDNLRASLQDLAVDSPGLTLGLRWLEENQPPPAPLSVLHGDFRIGNLIVGPDGLHAVIDWEFAHLGDPVEDVAWPLVRDWRFGNDQLRLGGISPPEPYFAAYEAATGKSLTPAAIRYWEIMGNMKWAVTCLVQAQRHLSGEDPSVELASLGRRSAEMEWELLRLIDAASSAGV